MRMRYGGLLLWWDAAVPARCDRRWSSSGWRCWTWEPPSCSAVRAVVHGEHWMKLSSS